MTAILSVRIESPLTAAEVAGRVAERLPHFRDVPGLIQKVFGHDPETGHVCGIYIFEDELSLKTYRESELAKSIPDAYQVLNVRRETFNTIEVLLPDKTLGSN